MKKSIFLLFHLCLALGISMSACSMVKATESLEEASPPFEEQLIQPSPPDTGAPLSTATLEVESESVRADLPDLGAAPELTNQVWLNTDKPLRLADLRGRVVLLEMWTFG